MGNLRLLMRQDRRSGEPRLEVFGAHLQPSTVRALEREIKRRFQQLVHSGDGSVVTLPTPIAGYAHSLRFRVHVTRGAHTRCPDLELEQIDFGEQYASTVLPTRNPPRPAVAELRELLPAESLTGLEPNVRLALERVIAELNLLAAKRPQVVPVVAIAGFLMLGQQLMSTSANAFQRYALATRGFNSLFATNLSTATPARQPQSAPNSVRAGIARTLRFSADLLGRLCGMGQPNI